MDSIIYEQQYVHDTYLHIYDRFSQTRYAIWPCVARFISMIPADETILDAGCGNGKNMIRSNMTGIDMCQHFVDICIKKILNVSYGDITHIPFPDNTFNNSMSIAVIHHLSTDDRRRLAINELIRVTNINGLIFILVWALDVYTKIKQFSNDNPSKQDVLIPFEKVSRYYHLFVQNELETLLPSNVLIINSFYEKGNYGIIIKKII